MNVSEHLLELGLEDAKIFAESNFRQLESKDWKMQVIIDTSNTKNVWRIISSPLYMTAEW